MGRGEAVQRDGGELGRKKASGAACKASEKLRAAVRAVTDAGRQYMKVDEYK